MIKSVKVWRNIKKTETRIYVTASDGRQGCKYMTETYWHKRGEIDGNLTAEEWTEAKRLAVQDGKWTTIYLSDQPRHAGNDEDVHTDLEAMRNFIPADRLDGAALLEERGCI